MPFAWSRYARAHVTAIVLPQLCDTACATIHELNNASDSVATKATAPDIPEPEYSDMLLHARSAARLLQARALSSMLRKPATRSLLCRSHDQLAQPRPCRPTWQSKLVRVQCFGQSTCSGYYAQHLTHVRVANNAGHLAPWLSLADHNFVLPSCVRRMPVIASSSRTALSARPRSTLIVFMPTARAVLRFVPISSRKVKSSALTPAP